VSKLVQSRFLGGIITSEGGMTLAIQTALITVGIALLLLSQTLAPLGSG
jgi:hypothetical protein